MGITWLLPRDRTLYEHAQQAAAALQKGTRALGDLLNQYGALAERRQQIRELEQHVTHLGNSMRSFAGRWTSPLRSEDVVDLAVAFEEAVAGIYAIVNRLYFYQIKKVTPEMSAFAQLLDQQAHILDQATRLLPAPRRRAELERMCHEVDRLEAEGDRMLNQTLGKLFEAGDVLQILKLKEVYEVMETATDRLESVGDVLVQIARKR